MILSEERLSEPPPIAQQSEQVLRLAVDLATSSGVRILPDGKVGIWLKDKGNKKLRFVLAALGMATLEVLYLDEPGVPSRFKITNKPDPAGVPFSKWYTAEVTKMMTQLSGTPCPVDAKTTTNARTKQGLARSGVVLPELWDVADPPVDVK